MNKIVDVFPAIVKIAPPDSLSATTDLKMRGDVPKGTRKLDRCRIVVMDSMILIAEDAPEGPKLVFREQISGFHEEKRTYWVQTVSGKIMVFEKDNNCGCGSRLRTWNPYRTIMASE